MIRFQKKNWLPRKILLEGVVFCGIYRPEWLQRGDPMKLDFGIFQIVKWILPTIRARRVDEKNGVACLVSISCS